MGNGLECAKDIWTIQCGKETNKEKEKERKPRSCCLFGLA